ncbi:MAG TPA: hypothetical protein VLE95_07325 [Chlamydiales bacterium]|nr:hypothetical protein [Chlamydiales bacterium]
MTPINNFNNTNNTDTNNLFSVPNPGNQSPPRFPEIPAFDYLSPLAPQSPLHRDDLNFEFGDISHLIPPSPMMHRDAQSLPADLEFALGYVPNLDATPQSHLDEIDVADDPFSRIENATSLISVDENPQTDASVTALSSTPSSEAPSLCVRCREIKPLQPTVPPLCQPCDLKVKDMVLIGKKCGGPCGLEKWLKRWFHHPDPLKHDVYVCNSCWKHLRETIRNQSVMASNSASSVPNLEIPEDENPQNGASVTALSPTHSREELSRKRKHAGIQGLCGRCGEKKNLPRNLKTIPLCEQCFRKKQPCSQCHKMTPVHRTSHVCRVCIRRSIGKVEKVCGGVCGLKKSLHYWRKHPDRTKPDVCLPCWNHLHETIRNQSVMASNSASSVPNLEIPEDEDPQTGASVTALAPTHSSEEPSRKRQRVGGGAHKGLCGRCGKEKNLRRNLKTIPICETCYRSEGKKAKMQSMP